MGATLPVFEFCEHEGQRADAKGSLPCSINSFFDLYSMGKDGQSVTPLTAKASQDDIIWANDGAFCGPAADF